MTRVALSSFFTDEELPLVTSEEPSGEVDQEAPELLRVWREVPSGGSGARGTGLAVAGDVRISQLGGGLLLTIRSTGHIAVSELGGRPSVALGIAGDGGGAKLGCGERLAAAGSGDVGVSELAGGGLSGTGERNDDGSGGLVLVGREKSR